MVGKGGMQRHSPDCRKKEDRFIKLTQTVFWSMEPLHAFLHGKIASFDAKLMNIILRAAASLGGEGGGALNTCVVQ